MDVNLQMFIIYIDLALAFITHYLTLNHRVQLIYVVAIKIEYHLKEL